MVGDRISPLAIGIVVAAGAILFENRFRALEGSGYLRFRSLRGIRSLRRGRYENYQTQGEGSRI